MIKLLCNNEISRQYGYVWQYFGTKKVPRGYEIASSNPDDQFITEGLLYFMGENIQSILFSCLITSFFTENPTGDMKNMLMFSIYALSISWFLSIMFYFLSVISTEHDQVDLPNWKAKRKELRRREKGTLKCISKCLCCGVSASLCYYIRFIPTLYRNAFSLIQLLDIDNLQKMSIFQPIKYRNGDNTPDLALGTKDGKNVLKKNALSGKYLNKDFDLIHELLEGSTVFLNVNLSLTLHGFFQIFASGFKMIYMMAVSTAFSLWCIAFLSVLNGNLSLMDSAVLKAAIWFQAGINTFIFGKSAFSLCGPANMSSLNNLRLDNEDIIIKKTKAKQDKKPLEFEKFHVVIPHNKLLKLCQLLLFRGVPMLNFFISKIVIFLSIISTFYPMGDTIKALQFITMSLEIRDSLSYLAALFTYRKYAYKQVMIENSKTVDITKSRANKCFNEVYVTKKDQPITIEDSSIRTCSGVTSRSLHMFRFYICGFELRLLCLPGAKCGRQRNATDSQTEQKKQTGAATGGGDEV